MPTWSGNEFLLPNGHRPVIRTLTPRHLDDATSELVVRDRGARRRRGIALGERREAGRPGGPFRARSGLSPRSSGASLRAGGRRDRAACDRTAARVDAERASDRRLCGGAHRDRAALTRCFRFGPATPSRSLGISRAPTLLLATALVAAVRSATIPDGARIWAAGEAAAMQQIRRHLFDERRVPRSAATVRGYWKHGRSGDPDSNDE